MERTAGPLLRVSKVWGKQATPGYLCDAPSRTACAFPSVRFPPAAAQLGLVRLSPHWPLSPGFENHTLMTHMYTAFPTSASSSPASPPRRDTPSGFSSLLDAAAPLRPGLITVNKALLGPAPTCPASSPAPWLCLDEIGCSRRRASPTPCHQCTPGLAVFFHRAFIIIYLYHYSTNDYFASYCVNL